MLEHPFDFAVLAFAQTDGEPGVRPLLAIERRLDPGIIDALDIYAAAQAIQHALVGLALGADPVAPQPASGRKLEQTGEAAIVGEQQKTLGIDVEPANADDARALGPRIAKMI
jgi:hypothetical protein